VREGACIGSAACVFFFALGSETPNENGFKKGPAATGAVASRTFPLLARTTAVDAETQTDPMVFPFVFPGGGWSL
jgi:hypothetical protein